MEMFIAEQNYGFVGLNPWVRDKIILYILYLNYSEHQSHNLKNIILVEEDYIYFVENKTIYLNLYTKNKVYKF